MHVIKYPSVRTVHVAWSFSKWADQFWRNNPIFKQSFWFWNSKYKKIKWIIPLNLNFWDKQNTPNTKRGSWTLPYTSPPDIVVSICRSNLSWTVLHEKKKDLKMTFDNKRKIKVVKNEKEGAVKIISAGLRDDCPL